MANLDKRSALAELKLSGDPDEQAVITAFARLARRYPMHQFPVRYERLLQAKEVLLKPDSGFRAILYGDEISLDWYHGNPDEEQQSLPAHVAAILRAAMLDSSTIEGENDRLLQQMIEAIGPEELEKMFGKRGGFFNRPNNLR